MEPLPPPPPPPEAGAADMLSSLPAHLLDEILTRLHIRALLRTSGLSCSWRHRWESLPGLALCFPKGTHPSVIDHVLLRYTGSRISRFVSYDVDNEYRDSVAHWLVALSRLSVESIKIHKEWGDADVSFEQLLLHSSIFSCNRLKSLNLHNCSIPYLPRSGFAGFPVLEELYLSGIFFPYPNEKRELEAIIRGSPLLRVLELVEVFPPDECMIEAPNLQTLVLVLQSGVQNSHDDDDIWRFGRLPCLQYAKIDVPFIGEHRLLEYFAGISQVQELIFVLPEHHDMAKIHRIPFTFHNLKRLEMETFAFMEPSFLLFSLLRSSPNLEELKIKIQTFKPKWVTNSGILSEEWTDGMCDNLQVVQIDSILQLCPLTFLKLILSKARLLRTLSVDVLPVSQDNPQYELLKCRKASAQAQILFELQKCRKASAQAQILFKEVDLDIDSDGEDLDSDSDDMLDSESDGEDLDSDSDGEVNE